MQTPATPILADDEDDVGFVLVISGTWKLDGSTKPLAGGQDLPAGAWIRPEKPDAGAYIVVSLYTGKAETYKKAVQLPPRVESNLVSRIWKAVFGHSRGGVVTAASRSVDLLQDTVLKLEEGKLNLAPALAETPAGTWHLRLSSWPAAAKKAPGQEKITVKAKVRWDPDVLESAEIEAGELEAGLYELGVVNERSGRLVGVPALVLVCRAADFDGKRASFDEAVALTESWDEETRLEAASQFLRVFLQALAENEPNPASPSGE
jgi:hypothetical protein